MMNYLWAGLILASLVFAIGNDVVDASRNTFRNNVPLPVVVEWPDPGPTPDAAEQVTVRLPDEAWTRYFGRTPTPAEPTTLSANVIRSGDGTANLDLTAAALPAPLSAIRKFHDSDEKLLRGRVLVALPPRPAASATAATQLRFEPVRLPRLRAINDAAIAFAQTAFDVVLKLVGGLTLWLGLLKIAEDSGLVNLIVRVVRPVLRPLFPGVPNDSPALGLITLNVAANLLALGNAATPIGIKAMQELQRLNPVKDTATNAMVMLLAINTAGVTLLPSPSLVGIMGPRIGQIMGPILLTTGVSFAIAIITCKLLERRRSEAPAEA